MGRYALLLSGAVLLAACAADPRTRETFLTPEGQTVLHNGAGQPFEVRFRAGNGAGDYWCAAGRFAFSEGLSPATRIFRLTPVPRPQGAGIAFAFAFAFAPPPGGAQPTGLLVLGREDGLSASFARQQCGVLDAPPIDL